MPAQVSAIQKQLTHHVTEREKTERFLGVQYKVTTILARAAGPEEAARPILQMLCESLDWEVGLFWTVDRSRRR